MGFLLQEAFFYGAILISIFDVMKNPFKNARVKHTFLLMVLFVCTAMGANSKAHCDSLIQSGIDAMWKKDYRHSIELLTQARDLAEKNRWYEQLFRATNNIGANYFAMLDYGEALNYYLESYTIAVKELEPRQEMVILNNIAILYSKEKNYDKAKEHFLKAYNIARENKNGIKTGLYAMNLGQLANETGNLKTARIYITESFKYLKDEPQLFIIAQSGLAENDLLAGNTAQAREKAMALYKNVTNLNFNNVGRSLLFIIARSYLKEGNYAMVMQSAKKLLADNPNAETRQQVFELLSEAYAKDGSYAKSLQYKDSVIAAIKELEESKNKELLKNNEVKFEVQSYKNQLAINEEKRSAERKIFFTVVALILIAVTLLGLTFRNRAIKHKQKKVIAERNQQIISLELEKEKKDNLLLEKQIREKETNALLEQERLKNEIEARNRKLSAKALYLSGRNELIEEILSSLSKITELSKDKALVNHMKTLREHVNTDGEWDSFITHFEEVNHGFLTRLKALHPALTANDIRFIAYIYMNLSNKEIASMLNITAEACRKRKERLASKMELSENTSLYDYLSSI
jgi:tetratricopeptide (TPR) repeat protein